jgi:hypothetical protein
VLFLQLQTPKSPKRPQEQSRKKRSNLSLLVLLLILGEIVNGATSTQPQRQSRAYEGCKICNVYLCVKGGCFERYHSINNTVADCRLYLNFCGAKSLDTNRTLIGCSDFTGVWDRYHVTAASRFQISQLQPGNSYSSTNIQYFELEILWMVRREHLDVTGNFERVYSDSVCEKYTSIQHICICLHKQHMII